MRVRSGSKHERGPAARRGARSTAPRATRWVAVATASLALGCAATRSGDHAARGPQPLALAADAAARRAVVADTDPVPPLRAEQDAHAALDGPALRERFARARAWRGLLAEGALGAEPTAEDALPVPELPFAEDDVLRALARGTPALDAAERRLAATFEGYDQVGLLTDLAQRLRAFTRTATPIRSGPAMAAGDRAPAATLAPWPALEALRGELALRSAEIAFEGLRGVALEQATRALALAARLELVATEDRTERAQLALRDDLLAVARAALAAGRGRQADLLTLEAARERSRGRLAELDGVRDGLEAALRAVLDLAPEARRAAGAGAEPPETADRALQTPPPSPPDLEDSPTLAAARARAARAGAALRLAEVMALGPTDLGASRFERGLRGEAGASRPSLPGLALPPPDAAAADFGAREALLRELRLAADAAERDVDAVRRELEARSARAAGAWAEAATRCRVLVDEVLPRDRAAYETLRGAWSGGAAGFVDLDQAARRVLDTELALARARLDLALARIEWIAATGARPELAAQGAARKEK